MLPKRSRTIILILVYIFLGVYCFVLSDNGILERVRLLQNKKEIVNSISGLAQENNNLQKELSIISNPETNGDFYKKEAWKSGFAGKGEKRIFFKSEKKDQRKTEDISKENKYRIDISHLRLLWIVSSLIILSLFIRKKKTEEKEDGENLGV